MKRMFGILALMVIASIMIAGCVQPTGNETATPGTTTPGVTETPMATTTTETPVATTTTETPMATTTTETPATTATPMETGTTTATPTTAAANVTETPPGPPAAGGETVSIIDSGFVPDTLTISPGTTVTWTNDAATNETITATGQAAYFDSGMLQPGDSYNYTFTAPDNYSYMSQTSGFTGTVVVTGNTTS